jgi:hypothetical protein
MCIVGPQGMATTPCGGFFDGLGELNPELSAKTPMGEARNLDSLNLTLRYLAQQVQAFVYLSRSLVDGVRDTRVGVPGQCVYVREGDFIFSVLL